MHGLAEIDVALATQPEADWLELAGPVLLVRHSARIGLDSGETAAAVRRAQYVAAAAGDPLEGGGDPDGPAIAHLAEELGTRERRSALADAIRADVARAVAGRLPRVESVLRRLGRARRRPRAHLAPVLRRPVRARRGSGIALPESRHSSGLLVLAFASQASISIFQWGGGALAPALQDRSISPRPGSGALLGATSAGNAVALVLAGSVVDRLRARASH